MAWPTVTSGQIMTAAQYNSLSAASAAWAGSVDAQSNTLSNVVCGSGWNLNGKTIAGAATFTGQLSLNGGMLTNAAFNAVNLQRP